VEKEEKVKKISRNTEIERQVKIIGINQNKSQRFCASWSRNCRRWV